MEDTEAVGVIITLLKDKYTIKEENCFCTALNINVTAGVFHQNEKRLLGHQRLRSGSSFVS